MRLEPNPANACFGCGGANASGLQLTFEQDDDAQRIRGSFRIGQQFQGGSGYLHGGIIATVLDEVMAKVGRLRGVSVVTAELTVEYLRPVPVDADLEVEGYEVKRDGRNLYFAGEIRSASGVMFARSHARFVEIDLDKLRASARAAEPAKQT